MFSHRGHFLEHDGLNSGWQPVCATNVPAPPRVQVGEVLEGVEQDRENDLQVCRLDRLPVVDSGPFHLHHGAARHAALWSQVRVSFIE